MTISAKDFFPSGGGATAPFYNDPLPAEAYISGRYYGPSVDYKFTSGAALAADTIFYVPFVPFAAATFTKISVYNTSAGENGNVFRLALYDSADGRPDSLLTSADNEITLGAAAALRTATISYTVAVETLYFIAISMNQSSTVYCFKGDTNVGLQRPTLNTYGITAAETAIDFGSGRGMTESHVYGAGVPSTAAAAFAGDSFPKLYLGL